MKNSLSRYTRKIMEAPMEYEYVVDGVFPFNSKTTDDTIIDFILKDFTMKCDAIIKEVQDPQKDLCTLKTYDIFHDKYETKNPGGLSCNCDEIYSDIPADLCFDCTESGLDKKTFRSIFGEGEFPIVTIWKSKEIDVKNDVYVTYAIAR